MTENHSGTHSEQETGTTPTRFKKSTSFLDLPRELRDEIYTYALRADILVHVGPRLPQQSPSYVPIPESHRPPVPCLLRANKQVYREAVDVLYGRNMFRFWNPELLLDFEEQIGVQNTKRIENICLDIRYPNPNEINSVGNILNGDWEG
jgi:hypothetical protein